MVTVLTDRSNNNISQDVNFNPFCVQFDIHKSEKKNRNYRYQGLKKWNKKLYCSRLRSRRVYDLPAINLGISNSKFEIIYVKILYN